MADSKQASKQLSKQPTKVKPAKKEDPNAIKPNNKLPIIAAVFIFLGGAWSIYSYNPGGALRDWTEEEKKQIREEATKVKEDAEREVREAKLKADREKAMQH